MKQPKELTCEKTPLLLETWKFNSLEEMNHTLYFGNWNRITSDLQRKYPGKKLSFQTVSKAFNKGHEFNVYEVEREKDEK